MSNKKRIIIISLVMFIIMLIGIIAGIRIFTKNEAQKTAALATVTKKENKLESLTEIEKEILGVEEEEEEEEEEEKEYSDLYEEYLELPEEEKEKLDVIPREEEVPFEKLDEIKEELDKKEEEKEKEENKEEDKNENDENDDNGEQDDEKDENDETEKDSDGDGIPDRFNLADKINIKIEDQSIYGLCWGFASLNTLETHLALNDLGEYDFSEIHLDYIESQKLYGYRSLHDGGNFGVFKDYIIESGVVLEETLPYSTDREYSEEEYEKFIDMESVITVTETVDFPSIYKTGSSVYTDEEMKEFRDTVKRHIMTNGGLYTNIVSDSGINHYTAPDSYAWPDHAVTIVGWDDNYSKDNFTSIDGKKPSKDGAYIVLNSWGEAHNDKGYYYISYEDKNVETNLSGIVSVSMENAYRINSIKNEKIKEFLEEKYSHLFVEYEGEKYITKAVIDRIDSIDLSNRGLTSIDGIEMFTNLYAINLSNNNISDITPLTKIVTLGSINLSNNNISDISAFENLKSKSLNNLNLSNNKIKDISPLENTTAFFYSLDVSNNIGITGFKNLKEVGYLNASGCNIKDIYEISGMTNLIELNISNNPEMIGYEFLPNVSYLDISNCNLNEIPKIPRNVVILNISNNNLTNFDGAENINNLSTLNISGNLITDWQNLKNIDMQATDKEYISAEITIIANNCNIEDISVFNDLSVTTLELKDNNITDISSFNNENVYNIDLSNNKGLTGLEALSKASVVVLNNCDISNLEEILKLTNVSSLSLENNNITDITRFSELSNLVLLSLAGNKEITGTLVSDDLCYLNVSDCNLNNEVDFSQLSNLNGLNIQKNPEITDISKIATSINSNYINIIVEQIDYYEAERLNELQHIYFENTEIILNCELEENETEINLSNYKAIRKALISSFLDGVISVENGKLNKKVNNIKITNKEKGYIKIEPGYAFMNTYGSKVKIIFKEKQEEIPNEEPDLNEVVEENVVI